MGLADLQRGVLVVTAHAEKAAAAAEGDSFSAARAFVADVTNENNRRSAVSVVRLVEQRLQLVKAAVNVAHDKHALLKL